MKKQRSTKQKISQQNQLNQIQQKYFAIRFLSAKFICRNVIFYFDGVTLLKRSSTMINKLDHKITNILKTHVCQDRASRLHMFFKIGVLENSQQNNSAGMSF